MQSVSLEFYLIISAIIFTIGTIGVLTRRNAIIVFMSIELMLNAVNLTFVAFSAFMGEVAGQIFVFFIMAVAAGEATIGLAIVLALFRIKQTVNIDEASSIKF
ncbi:MAG: NADH-quinone oxidoreductase subunit NuoK [Candidatus Kapaibacteriales bacterium]